MAVWFALGLLAQHFERIRFAPTSLPLLLLSLLALCGLAGAGIRRNMRLSWVPVAAVWLVLGFAAGQWQPSPENPARLMSLADNLSRTVRGAGGARAGRTG